MARRSKLTPETQKRICDALVMGATYELASKYAGIHYDTLREWMNTKPAFSDAVKEAEGRAVIGWLAKIEKAASDGNWQAAAWKLERRYPRSYGRVVQEQQHSGSIRVEFVNDWRVARSGERDADGGEASSNE